MQIKKEPIDANKLLEIEIEIEIIRINLSQNRQSETHNKVMKIKKR